MNVKIKNISIPYGAIKSKKRDALRKAIETFQFLMVRLKVRHTCATAIIKGFQFLMVRLKEIYKTSL